MTLFLPILLTLFSYKTSATYTCSEKLAHSSLTTDFEYRDSLPETFMSLTNWSPTWGKWGPWPRLYPKPTIPNHLKRNEWMRKRVALVSKRYIGLPYKHRHIPVLGGLDCSNFTSWIYNYGLGIFFPSDIEKQSFLAGRLLLPREDLRKGDLIFIWDKNYSRISHVVMYLNGNLIIDSAKGGVKVREWRGWRRTRVAWVRRVIN